MRATLIGLGALLAATVLAVVVGLILAEVSSIVAKLDSDNEEAAFQGQLRLARAEGIPTDWEEFKATIPTAKPSENAAPLYRQAGACSGARRIRMISSSKSNTIQAWPIWPMLRPFSAGREAR